MNELSVIVPVHNEKESVRSVILDLVNALEGFNYEIVAVDDASTDETVKIIEELNIEKLRLIKHPSQRGYGSAIKTGIKNASFGIICIIDGDATYPADKIPDLMKKMDTYDMAVGARTGESVSIPNLRKPAKKFIGILANYLSGTKIPDLNSGLRIFKKSQALKYFNIYPAGFSFTTTITLAYLCSDHWVHYEPVNYYKRKGKSKIKPVRHTAEFSLLVLRLIMYFKPLKVFIPLSGIIFTAGFLRMLYTVINRNTIHEFSVLTILISITILFMGLIADMIVKMRNEN